MAAAAGDAHREINHGPASEDFFPAEPQSSSSTLAPQIFGGFPAGFRDQFKALLSFFSQSQLQTGSPTNSQESTELFLCVALDRLVVHS